MTHAEPEDKMVAKEVATASQLKVTDNDPAGKEEGFGMSESPALCVSAGNDCPKTSVQSFTDNLQTDIFNRGEISLVGSEPPSTSTYPMNNRWPVVDEFTMRNSGIPNSELASSSNSRRGMHFRHGMWKNLYQFGGLSRSRNHLGDYKSKDKDPMPLNYREDFQRMPLDTKTLNSLQSKLYKKDVDEMCAHVKNPCGNTISGNTPTPEVNRSMMLSSSGFSKFFCKQSLKRKEVPSRVPRSEAESNTPGIYQNKGKQAIMSVEGHDTLLNYTGKINQSSDFYIDKTGSESFRDGMSLREWLKPGCHDINKPERLQLFRQIVEFVDFAHSQGFVLQDLQPSHLILLPSNAVKYSGLLRKKEISCGLNHVNKRRSTKFEAKLQKLCEETNLKRHHTQFGSSFGNTSVMVNPIDASITGIQNFSQTELEVRNDFSHQSTSTGTPLKMRSVTVELEKKWYACPEEPDEESLLSSNIYSLGVLLFELLCCFESSKMHSAAMSDLSYRILPSKFLSENLHEAGFCLSLLHPEPISRPTTRDILQSKLICYSQQTYLSDRSASSVGKDDDTESELLLYFLISLKENKQKHAAKLIENMECLEADIKEVVRRHLMRKSSDSTRKDSPGQRRDCHLQNSIITNLKSISAPNTLEGRITRDNSQLEDAYFQMRSQIQLKETAASGRTDKDVLTNRDRWSSFQIEKGEPKKPDDQLGTLFEDVCKFAHYSKFEVCGTLKYSDLLNSPNVICALSFDREEDYFAAAGVSKKIKIFECNSLLDDSIDIHYPVVEMCNNSKLSSVCWNNYIKNYLASTDYDGVVQVWDASSGQGFSKYTEHQKRAWSVDFSHVDPTKFASGSDDCSVKLWSVNEKSSVSTIWSPANICCVQFSAYSSHLLAFGSADFKIYCYDLRNTRIPWCSLSGHGKAVSCVKFLDAETLVSASTDNTLKLWDLNRTNLEGLSTGSCSLTFNGHTNKKNFVGLAVCNGYMACGSETNEVYAYYRSLPMPITSHKFGAVDPILEHDSVDNNGLFVSSVCWRGKSNMIVAANSSGTIKLLRMV